jgi:predicted nucleic acid-binding protein
MSAEDGWQFVDSNILVYAHDAAAGPRHEMARALLESLWRSRRGCLSIQVLQEFYVTVTRKVARPYAPAKAARIITDLQLWRTHVPAAGDVLAAIEVQTRYQLSFWDAMILYSANSLGCSVLWTEDLTAGQVVGQTTVRNPFKSGDPSL